MPMTKPEAAQMAAFFARHYALRCLDGAWARFDGRRWREISSERLVEMFRLAAAAAQTKRAGADEAGDGSISVERVACPPATPPPEMRRATATNSGPERDEDEDDQDKDRSQKDAEGKGGPEGDGA